MAAEACLSGTLGCRLKCEVAAVCIWWCLVFMQPGAALAVSNVCVCCRCHPWGAEANAGSGEAICTICFFIKTQHTDDCFGRSPAPAASEGRQGQLARHLGWCVPRRIHLECKVKTRLLMLLAGIDTHFTTGTCARPLQTPCAQHESASIAAASICDTSAMMG